MKDLNFKYSLGDLAKDKITGFEGIIMYRTQWLHNCNVYGLKPTKLKNGEPMESIQFDEPQIVILKSNVFKTQQETGGPTQKIIPTNRV